MKIENMHARNRRATPQDRAPKTEKMLSQKRFGRSKVLWRGEGDTDDPVRNLDSLNIKAGENRRTSAMISFWFYQPACGRPAN